MVKTMRLFEPKRDGMTRQPERRGSSSERGYDYEWDRLASVHRRKFPVCMECERNDRLVPCNVVDHKIPVKLRPDLRLDKRNLWSLCNSCHNGIKRKMERYAERMGMIDLLPDWCDDPASRPRHLRDKKAPPSFEDKLMV